MGRQEIESRIKFLETVLSQYRRLSELSNISFRTQEGTIDEMLDELKKLYEERDRN